MNVGENIKKEREKLHLTQEELAKRMGYKTPSSIAKVETGANDITQTRLVQFAKALNTTPAHLMGWDTLENLANTKYKADKCESVFSKMDDSTFQKWIEIGEMLIK